MWQAPISTTQPVPPDQDQLQVQQPAVQPGGFNISPGFPSQPSPTQDLAVNPKPLPGTFERRRFNPGGHAMPSQAKAKGLTSWLGAGNNKLIGQPQPTRNGNVKGQNPYLKLAGANKNRARLGKRMGGGGNRFNRGLQRSYQNFLGSQASPQGQAMRRPGGKAFRNRYRRTPQPTMDRATLMKQLQGQVGGASTDYDLMTNKGTAVPSAEPSQWQTLT